MYKFRKYSTSPIPGYSKYSNSSVPSKSGTDKTWRSPPISAFTKGISEKGRVELFGKKGERDLSRCSYKGTGKAQSAITIAQEYKATTGKNLV